MAVKLIAKRAHRYGTRMMQAGEGYEVPGESMARLMTALGHADRDESKEKAKAAAAPKAEPAPVAAKTTRRRLTLRAAEDKAEPPAPAPSTSRWAFGTPKNENTEG